MPTHENPVINHGPSASGGVEHESHETQGKRKSVPRHGIPIVTTDELPGMQIEQTVGLCFGTAVRSRSIFGNMLGSLRATFGGGQQGYAQMISQTRDEAIEALVAHAMSMGANAVVAMRFDSGEFDSGNGQSMNEVAAYGTAVVVRQR